MIIPNLKKRKKALINAIEQMKKDNTNQEFIAKYEAELQELNKHRSSLSLKIPIPGFNAGIPHNQQNQPDPIQTTPQNQQILQEVIAK